MAKKKIEAEATVRDILLVLEDKGVIDGVACDRMLERHGDRELIFEVRLDASDLVEFASSDTLLAELEDRPGYTPAPEFDEREIAEGIRYVARGETVLAEAMFARQFDDGAMVQISAALRQ